MTEHELRNALDESEKQRAQWMQVSINLGNEMTKSNKQIEQLKAQVNCLREVLINIDKDNYDEPTFVIQDALSLTQEQCLTEVEIQAIKDFVGYMSVAGSDTDVEYYIDTLREVAI